MVTTNLNLTGAAHDNVKQWRTLGSVTNKIDLYWSDGSAKNKDDFHNFALNLSSYNAPSQNSAIISYLSDIANTGQIIYYNNGENVEEFSLRIPVRIFFERVAGRMMVRPVFFAVIFELSRPGYWI